MTIARSAVLAWTIATVGVLSVFDPAVAAWFPPCPFHELTGLNCPGCGTARALHALVHLDVVSALHANAFVTTMLGPLLGAALVGAGGSGPLARLASPPGLKRVVVGLAVFGIVRNVPLWPFTWLNP